jgi:hypothetical protein
LPNKRLQPTERRVVRAIWSIEKRYLVMQLRLRCQRPASRPPSKTAESVCAGVTVASAFK